MATDRSKVDFLSKSSLPLQILLFFNRVWVFCWFLVLLGVFIWKGTALPYPDTRLAPEILLLFAYLFVENVRLFLCSKGNKIESRLIVLLSTSLMIPSALANIYYILFQIYVLRVDEIFNVISLIFLALELAFSLYAILNFSSTA
eukprot:CAMPEP_0173384622 /NCGR_PEP_ID=MMETSP1356-20130122/7196_1 /TAXON_ID=77927 ORGANISM="Hemiselmis virescens, Strain PCC157" /NCGR_SAMPLE_ID=MMETSP1356 /ASSEMBLY_ACC=CAM_ASM_000847 /LENGTH=144 /DNA_ID=CAMNT_0014340067 /DNA_START=98 /DNA_END=532 /DNA_ORIENTATION=+